MPIDSNDHDDRAARINVMLEELRLNTEDLHELARQAIDRSWEDFRAARITEVDARAPGGFQPSAKTRQL